MIIANIITDNKLDLSLEFNQISNITDIIDNSLPTLIIGWYKTKELYPEQDILERKINDNLFWIFKKSESRDKYESELFDFIELSYKNLIKDIDYVFIDPLNYSLSKIKKILTKIKNSKDIIGYKHDQMIYLYTNKIIFGIDLKLLEFIGINTYKIITKLRLYTYVFIEKNIIFSETNQILIEYKHYIEKLNNEIKYIPYLYSLKNENRTPSLLPVS